MTISELTKITILLEDGNPYTILPKDGATLTLQYTDMFVRISDSEGATVIPLNRIVSLQEHWDA